MKRQYRITARGKILIAQFIICLLGVTTGFTWGINNENKKWAQVFGKNAVEVTTTDKTEDKKDDKPKEEIAPKETGTKDSAIINTCIASFSTKLDFSSEERNNNIGISIKAINGKLLMPGEVFSFNEAVGERTRDKGYLEAPVIIGNKQGMQVGGGICQVTSTLYNAILVAGVQNIERTHHTVPAVYIKPGLDATVDWGMIDFKFTNTLEYPISIEGYVQNKELYINIFSNPNLNKKKYTIENKITESKDVYVAEVIRNTYENGVVTNSEIISKDEYVKGSSE